MSSESTTKPANLIVPLKAGFFGEQGTGKSTSAALLSAALAKQFHNGAQVWVSDPELSWQFLDPIIFRPEGVKLVQRTNPTFKALLEDLHAAERAGACVFVVELAKYWRELLETVQKKCGDRWGSELVNLWDEWVTAFLNSPLHCLALARVSDITEDIQNERGDIKRVKVAEGMKAGGQRNNFGYEPHLVLRMSLERKPRRKQGKLIADEGRMVHRADVLKDRTWSLNGKTLRWTDRDSYKPGDYRYVWADLKPHFERTQMSVAVKLDAAATSAEMIDEDGNSAWNAERAERDILFDEFQELGELMFGGQTREAKRQRVLIAEAITGEISRERIRQMPALKLRDAVKVLAAMRKRMNAGEKLPATDAELVDFVRLATMDVNNPATTHPTLMEYLLQNSPGLKRASACVRPESKVESIAGD